MAAEIVTKFAIGTEQGIKTIMSIGAATVSEKYAGKVTEDKLESFIKSNFSHEVLNTAMNSLSNQYLVVYADGEPAGYARITSQGQRPEILQGKAVARIADFDILKKFNDIQVKKNLFEKCLAVCALEDFVWISEYEGNPDVDFFESYGFRRKAAVTAAHELGLKPVLLVKEKQSSGTIEMNYTNKNMA